MPITPKFQVEQDENNITIRIHVPHIRVSAAEIIADNNEFSFYCKPYLLKLTFPGSFNDDEETYKAQYNPDEEHGTLTVTLMKRNPGEFFPDLDLIHKLLQIRKVMHLEDRLDTEGGVEVLHSENFVDENDISEMDEDDDCDEGNEEVRAGSNRKKSAALQLSNKQSYGFNNQYTNILTNLREQMLDMLEIENPELIHPQNRRYQRIQLENKLFDANRYLGDLFGSEEDEIYHEAMAYEPFWIQQWHSFVNKEKEHKQLHQSQSQSQTKADSNCKGTDDGENTANDNNSNSTCDNIQQKTVNENKQRWREESFEDIGGLTEKEQDTLMTSIKRKEYLIKSGSQKEFNLLMGLADILFAFCYDSRVTGGDFNVESPSNITRLSSVLSWLERYQYPADDISTTIKFNMRRLVVYPYLRVWKLGRKVLTDVVKLFLLGKRSLLKCLLQLHDVMEHTDTHYLVNKLFINDYCAWIQTVEDEVISKFGLEYNNAKNAFEKEPKNGKVLMGFYLDKIESWVEEEDLCGEETVPDEYTKYDELISSMEKLKYLHVSPVEVEPLGGEISKELSEDVVSQRVVETLIENKSDIQPSPQLAQKSTPTGTSILSTTDDASLVRPALKMAKGPLIQIISSTDFIEEPDPASADVK